ncbi:MFS transporter (plasmid) [Haloferax mediterranei ATCC 33500]|nr:MFS transporter [Haloferax mediterranei]AHZ24485.1 MFS transporter [Haloferax mediterranei ATCC 33500]ELZ97236.1 major facilitator superfamily transporter [Haloferax mediterranei ATCC 33500]MDX5990027.1 MFS transporter [Haloferax mediterranei ATCC 33500]QCQ77089.1 MFS transporter [Haloferax mediterranei ATCC 33500]
MLLTVSLAWAVLQAGRFLLSPLLPTIIEALQITNATAGIALALFQGIYAITQYPSGEYSDRWTRATLIVPGLGILVLGFATFGIAGGLTGFLLAAVITGFGKGLFAIPSRALLSDLFVERRGRALGLYAAGTDLGGLLASGLAILALSYATWQTPFLPVAVVLGALTLLFARWSNDGYTVGSPELDASGTLRRLFASPEQRRTLLAFGLFYFMVGGFINFLPTFLSQAKDFPEELASATFAIVFVVGLGIKPVAGGLSDHFRRESIAVVGMLIAAGSLAALSLVDTRLFIYVAVVVLAVGYKMEFPLADAIIVDNAPDADRGADLGAARALFLGANAVGPAYVGIVATYLNYAVAFGGLAVCLVVGAGLLYWDARRG